MQGILMSLGWHFFNTELIRSCSFLDCDENNGQIIFNNGSTARFDIEARVGAREMRLKPLERTKIFPSFEWSNFDFLSKISHKTRKNQKCQKYELVFYALRPLGKGGKSTYNKMLRTKAVGNLAAVIFPQRKRKSDY
jgi:hypothetical protein